jgi:sRNA-binding regulator protein Hfq
MVSRLPAAVLPTPAAGAGGEEEAHFQEVFQQFLETKRQCGEPVVGLTFEKFVVTLRKNKEQIVAKHGAAQVRFTVYVKDGKAALKARPIS